MVQYVTKCWNMLQYVHMCNHVSADVTICLRILQYLVYVCNFHTIYVGWTCAGEQWHVFLHVWGAQCAIWYVF